MRPNKGLKVTNDERSVIKATDSQVWRWQEIRAEVLRRDNKCCQVCGKPYSGQVHHVVPRSQGGTDDFDNLMTLCGRCHMLVSPVPDWLLTKVWQIPAGDIPIERQKTQAAIDLLRPS
ncbi:MAG: HNH endonuclease [Cyanosarcina radialis HA8281-LM2]|jgi:5-methylcytosine-specific restriction endonuclease McrA|nr:HNH endonuclease [Cyanosarcina radialis HA8281-LM2]